MVVGAIVMAIGVAAWVVAGWFLWRLVRMRRTARTAFVGLPERPYMVMPPSRPGELSQLRISGTLLGEPPLTAPATGRRCSVWELALVEIIPADYDYDSGEGVAYVWVGSRYSDLTIECDARVEFVPPPSRGQPFQVTPGVVTFRVAGDRIQVRPAEESERTDPGLSFFRGVRLPADVGALQRAGVPPDLVDRAREHPESFYLLEGSIAPGELVTLFQLTRVPGQVDPNAATMLGVMGYDGDMAAQGSSTVGCLSLVFAIAGTGAAVVGTFAFINGLLSVLP